MEYSTIEQSLLHKRNFVQLEYIYIYTHTRGLEL